MFPQNKAAVRWFKMDVASKAIEEGLIFDDELDFIYPSIAVNTFGDVVIGFTASSSNQFASSFAVAGQTDTNGVTTFSEPIQLKLGLASYERLDGSNRNRWGDYSATVVDPNDPRTFWTFQEFVPAEDEWAIQITQLFFPPSPVDTDVDGLPDFYEALYFAGPTNGVAGADDDADSFSNLKEYIADTNPTNPASFFSITAFTNTSGIALTLGQTSVARKYEMEVNADVTDTNGWSGLSPAESGTGGDKIIKNQTVGPNGNYRGKVMLP